MLDDLIKCQLGEDKLGGDTLALGAGGEPGKLIAGFLLIGFGKDLAQVGEGNARSVSWSTGSQLRSR